MPTLPEPRISVPRPPKGPTMLVTAPTRIRLARKSKQLSLRQLGILCRRSHQLIHYVETGVTRTVDEDVALALARHLDLPLEEVFATQTASRASVVATSSGMSCGGDPS